MSEIAPITVEVLLSTYNGELYLREQIRSILNQEDVSTFITIRDDGSSDRTCDCISEYKSIFPDRIKVLPHSTNLGVRDSFRLLLSQATADYIAFADQDDVWKPKKLKTLIDLIRENERHGQVAVLAHSDLEVVDKDLNPIASSFWKYMSIDSSDTRLLRLLIRNSVTGCTTAFNKKLVSIAKDIPDSIRMHDHWFSLCAAAFGKIIVCDERLILYRQHGSNVIGANAGQQISFPKKIYRIINTGIEKKWNQRLRILSDLEKVKNVHSLRSNSLCAITYRLGKASLRNRFQLLIMMCRERAVPLSIVKELVRP